MAVTGTSIVHVLVMSQAVSCQGYVALVVYNQAIPNLVTTVSLFRDGKGRHEENIFIVALQASGQAKGASPMESKVP